jgi:SAM-dependent methyltransferase
MEKDQNKALRDLILSYDNAADERDNYLVSDWKKHQCQRFFNLLHTEGKTKLIDIGSGTGIHGTFFQEQGIDVTCVDISPANVERCKEKGLESYVLDIMDLTSIGQLYDCAFALNSLLHIPTSQLSLTLANIHNVLKPDSLFFWGQYGGEYREGVYKEDNYEPKRFFSLLDDAQIQEKASKVFNIEDFATVNIKDITPLYFQSLILRVKDLS